MGIGIAAILSEYFSSSGTSMGRLLAKKETIVIEETEYYERGVGHRRTESLKVGIYDSKRFLEIYGKKKGVTLT